MFLKSRRYGIAIQRDRWIVRSAPQQLFGNPVAEFGQRLGDLKLDEIPAGLFRVAFQLDTKAPCPVSDAGRFGSQFRIVQHLFDIAQAVRPRDEVVPADWRHVVRPASA